MNLLKSFASMSRVAQETENTEEEKVGREFGTNKGEQTRKIENHIVQDSVGAGIAQWLERRTCD